MFVIPPLQDLMRQSVAVINDLEGGRDTPHNNYGHHYSSIDVVRKARVMDQNPEPDPPAKAHRREFSGRSEVLVPSSDEDSDAGRRVWRRSRKKFS